MAEKKTPPDEKKAKRESGLPGGGAGRKDEVGKSFVYPMSGPHPPGDAPLVAPGSWGQGKRGPAGYEDAGESELNIQFVAPEKCRDLMTKDPICCLETDTAEHASRLMKQHDLGVLPVVETQPSKKLLGIVTDRDLVLRILAEERKPREVRVSDIMTRDVIACSPDDGYEEALRLMEQHRIRRIPAIDNTRRVVGIIAQADVALRLRNSSKTAELMMEISQPA